MDADPLARALGVRRGIPLGSAHRLAPEATFLDLAPDPDRDALEAACERLAIFSPGIAGTSDVVDPAFGRIAVHVDGLVRLWGVEEVLVEGPSRTDGSVLRGRTRRNTTINFTGDASPGELVDVRIERATSTTLGGSQAASALSDRSPIAAGTIGSHRLNTR